MKIFTGTVGGVINGLTTLGGLPCAIFLLATGFEASIIRGSLAALFFFTDIYALFLSFFAEIIDMKSLCSKSYRKPFTIIPNITPKKALGGILGGPWEIFGGLGGVLGAQMAPRTSQECIVGVQSGTRGAPRVPNGPEMEPQREAKLSTHRS